ncbi:MAG: nucleotidyltransferase family protein [Muribaculaceae bacterium]
MKIIEMNIDKIIALCKKYKVAKLWVFGSILTPRFNDESDVDFLVDFDEQKIDLLDYADNFFNFIHEIEAIVGRKVDMVVNKSIRNRFFRAEVDETRKLLWSAQ